MPETTSDTTRPTVRVTTRRMIPTMSSVKTTMPTGSSHNQSMAASVGSARYQAKGPGR